MKKCVLTLAAVLTMGVGGYGVYASQETASKTSDLLLDNVEALAQDEWMGGVVCSIRSNDGIGKCWKRTWYLLDCERTDNPNSYCQS